MSALSATCISIWADEVPQRAVLVETQWWRKAREKVVDSSQHKVPQETAGGGHGQWVNQQRTQTHTRAHTHTYTEAFMSQNCPLGSACQAFRVTQYMVRTERGVIIPKQLQRIVTEDNIKHWSVMMCTEMQNKICVRQAAKYRTSDVAHWLST